MKSAAGEKERRAKHRWVQRVRLEAEELLEISRDHESFHLTVNALTRAFGLILSLARHAVAEADTMTPPASEEVENLCKLAEALPEPLSPSQAERASLRRLAETANSLRFSPVRWAQPPPHWQAEADAWTRTLRNWLTRIRPRLNRIYRADRRQSTFKRTASVLLILLLLGYMGVGIDYLWDDGLKVTFFRGTEFAEAVHRTTEIALNVDYGIAAPARGVPADGWCARWEGYLIVPEDADYRFVSQNLDGLRLFIDGEPVINNWMEPRSWKSSIDHAERHLTSGRHRFVVEHFDREGRAALRIRWAGGPIPPNTIIEAPYIQRRFR